ncbi:hypothetical protein C6P45_002060 [Maudiozyma exigua]|uniref:Uncharacterized protein n=1 Tax=Maudiozyma exigua TaxID=34358 RepID=A0A9P6W0J5_MAUEX|nr:hypothetical protein C6P45_002060 [Kazachstania exigua]
MSVATSLILTGIGGFFYKYDNNLNYEIDPNISLSVYDYKEKLIIPKCKQYQEYITLAVVNFFQASLNNQPFVYPLRGFLELLYYPNNYLSTTVGTFILYLISYIGITLLFWATLTPLYIGFFIILGPLGVLLAMVHTFLQSNLLTMMFIRLSHISSKLTILCLNEYLSGNDLSTSETIPMTKYYVPIGCTYFWVYYLPMKLLKYTMALLILIILLTISSMPIIGPVLFHLLVSPIITKIYLSKLLRLQKMDKEQRYNIFVTHFGCYTSFGMVASLIETIPIISGFAISTNTIGSTLLALETLSVDSNSNTNLLPDLCRSSITELNETQPLNLLVPLQEDHTSNHNEQNNSGILLSGLCRTSEIPSITLEHNTNASNTENGDSLI